jgi:hypothetical protein
MDPCSTPHVTGALPMEVGGVADITGRNAAP